MKRFLLSLALLSSTVSATPSRPLTVVALAKVQPGSETAFRAAADELVRETRKEPGNVLYTYHQNVQDPTEFAFVEKWESEGAIAAHFETPHLKGFFGKVKDSFLPGFPQIKTYNDVSPE